MLMLKKERQEFILREINLHNKVLTSDLCEAINVSEDTIRRDLSELAETGDIIKVHGGALSKSFHVSFQTNGVYSHDNKKLIAQKAVTLIRDGMFVLTTGGTTIIELAKALPHHLRATFFTGSLPAAMEYIQHPNIEVIFIGDKISKNSKITVGGDAITKIKQINADICFLGINAIDAQNGLTDNDWDVVQVKRAMMQSSKKVVALTIAEKINSLQKIKIAGIEELDAMITDMDPGDKIFDAYREKGVQIL
ncbi:MAG TPA: DeoR/GlpR family DNA-binding transcription regulator [Chitinophagaceae bacterium]|nr:DeoR/GlpR family DNA-binding transcription regulator [Chitinophagaceae bacterium]